MVYTVEEKQIVSKNIKFLLKDEKISRKRICTDLNIKYTTFCDWVNGKTAPSFNNITKLAGYFNVQPIDFYGDIEKDREKEARRLYAYSKGIARQLDSDGKLLDMDVLEYMSEDNVRALLDAGFRFRRRTLEEIVTKTGKPLRVSPEYDWGEPIGREIW